MKIISGVIFVFALASCGGDSVGLSSNSLEVVDLQDEEIVSGFMYTFEGDGAVIVDTSGNGNNATADSISRVDGKVGKAIKFIGEGSVINPPRDSFPIDEILTFSAWVKTDVIFTDRQQIIGGWTGGSPASFYPINNFGISFVDSKLSYEVSAYPGMTSVESNELPIGLDEWFHVVVTYNGDKVKFYFNGVLNSETSLITSFDSSFSNQIGHNYHVFSGVHVFDQFSGYLDDLSLVGKVLNDQEILDYYNLTK